MPFLPGAPENLEFGTLEWAKWFRCTHDCELIYVPAKKTEMKTPVVGKDGKVGHPGAPRDTPYTKFWPPGTPRDQVQSECWTKLIQLLRSDSGLTVV